MLTWLRLVMNVSAPTSNIYGDLHSGGGAYSAASRDVVSERGTCVAQSRRDNPTRVRRGHTWDACETDADKLEALVPETPRPCSPGRANRAEGGEAIARDFAEGREVEAARQERDIVRSHDWRASFHLFAVSGPATTVWQSPPSARSAPSVRRAASPLSAPRSRWIALAGE
jgi:hypothetical protein